MQESPRDMLDMSCMLEKSHEKLLTNTCYFYKYNDGGSTSHDFYIFHAPDVLLGSVMTSFSLIL